MVTNIAGASPPPPRTGACVHCGRPTVHRRGLCRRCYDLPEVREAHPPAGPGRKRTDTPAPPDADPRLATDALPGSEGKIAVLAERLRLHLPLHVLGDARDADARDDLIPEHFRAAARMDAARDPR